jgi:hypothetical protein
LDTLLEGGIVGLAFYTAWLLSCGRHLHRALRIDYNFGSLGIGFLLMMLSYNVTESTLSGLVHQMTALALLASMVIPYRAPLHARKLQGYPPLTSEADADATVRGGLSHGDIGVERGSD